MNTSSDEIITCESASVRIAPGIYFELPIVDNKDLFPNFFKTEENFRFQVQCNCINEFIYALYVRKENLAYLVCCWADKDEINEQAMQIIKSNPKLHYLLN